MAIEKIKWQNATDMRQQFTSHKLCRSVTASCIVHTKFTNEQNTVNDLEVGGRLKVTEETS